MKTPASTTSAAARILGRVRRRGPGVVLLSSDFLDLGSRRAVDTALHRLTRDRRLERLARGIYATPTERTRLAGGAPSLDAVVLAISRRTASRVQVAGEDALNRVGLSTQVPATSVYVTDGPTRRLVVGGRPVALRHVASRRLVGAGTTVGLVVQALHEVGQRGVTDGVVERLRRAVDPGELRRMRPQLRRLPAWQQDVLRRLTRRG